jgi:cysteine desulfurase
MKLGKPIYLDHQSTTPVDPAVLSAMEPYFRHSFGNPHSSDHLVGWKAASAVELAATRVARMIGADLDEIIFTSGATESNNLALLGLAHRAAGGSRRRLLVSSIEHKCVLAAARVVHQRYGFEIDLLPVDRDGIVDLSVLEERLGKDVLAVSVMAVNNEIGTIQDIEQISSLARSVGAIVHCDAAQAPITLNLEEMARQCDIVSLSAHKMYGPQGIGVIAISRDLHDSVEPLLHGGGQQNGLRSGTVPVPLCVGMGVAAELLSSKNAEDKRNSLRSRRDRFVQMLEDLPWPITVNGPASRKRHVGNASVCFRGFSAHEILGSMQPYVAASTGAACTSGVPEMSHVLKAIGLSSDEADASIRFSLGFDTTDDDVDEAIALVEASLERISRSNLGRLG